MIFPVFSERDLKVGFGFPYCAPNDEYAVRDFKIRSQQGLLQAAPQDFQLFKVGTFDTHTGSIEPCLPVLLIDGGEIHGS